MKMPLWPVLLLVDIAQATSEINLRAVVTGPSARARKVSVYVHPWLSIWCTVAWHVLSTASFSAVTSSSSTRASQASGTSGRRHGCLAEYQHRFEQLRGHSARQICSAGETQESKIEGFRWGFRCQLHDSFEGQQQCHPHSGVSTHCAALAVQPT